MTSVKDSNAEVPGSGSPLSGYVDELRDFFKSHEVQYGSPANMVPFAEKLAAGGSFREEMSSMVRSIILREGGNVPRVELLRIVSEAVGGAGIEGAAQEYVEPVRAVAAFLGGVHRSRWGVAPEEIAVSEPAGTSEPPTPGGDLAAAGLAEANLGIPEGVGESLEEKVEKEREALSHSLMGAPARWDHDVYSRAKAVGDGGAEQSGAEAVREADDARALVSVPEREAVVEGEDKKAQGRRWIYWAAAAVLTVAAAVGLLVLRERANEPNWTGPSPVAGAPVVTAAPAANAKPSPYGGPVTGTRRMQGSTTARGTAARGSASSDRESGEAGQDTAKGVPAGEPVEAAPPTTAAPTMDQQPAPIYRVTPPPQRRVEPREAPVDPPQALGP